MISLTGVYLTDEVSKSGTRFPISAIEDALWKGYNQCVPSNISHDMHRPLGVTCVSSMFLSHEMSYLLGNTFIPETKEEFKQVMRARTNYLNEKMIGRVREYSQGFYEELAHRGLLGDNGQLFSNGIVMYGKENIVYDAFPQLKTIEDGDGLMFLKGLKQWFDYKGDGVFVSKSTNLAVMIHPYLRRSLSRYNCFNSGFLDELFTAHSDATPVRIRLDLDYVGYAPSFISTKEFDFWYGPAYSDDISTIKEGVATYGTSETEYAYNQIRKTEFVWQEKDGKRQFEMEEVTDVEAPTLADGTYGCRYLHAFFDPKTDVFDHFDGAIRCYDLEQICERLDKPINAMGHNAAYTKLFRIDGKVSLGKWKSLITHYLKGNQDVYRYFGVEVPYVIENNEVLNPIAKYVPFVLKPDDGVRILYSYHTPGETVEDRCFMDFDTCNLAEGVVETADTMAVELTKCIRRVGGEIDYPHCRYVLYEDNFHNVPEIFHTGHKLKESLGVTLNGIRLLLDGLNKRAIQDCLSFCLSWIVEDRKVKVSFMGAVPDLLKWLSEERFIPTERDGLKNWLDKQSDYLKKNGGNTPSPINAKYIHNNGIFYHHRRLVQKDAKLNKLFYDDEKGLCASIRFTEMNKELLELIKNRKVSQAPFIVAEELVCEDGSNYLDTDKIASLGEVCFHPTIHFMNLVWASMENGLGKMEDN